jgi:gamma-glutamylcyclotransferase (GGCT)/AIG2-like uncharacterized protein YtfP
MDVFVYGSLTAPERVSRIVDSFAFVGPAVLRGLHAVEGIHPTLVPGGELGGRILRTQSPGALDTYEGVSDGLSVRVSVPASGEHLSDAVALYVGDPDALGAAATWPGEDPFADRVTRYISDEPVRVEAR